MEKSDRKAFIKFMADRGYEVEFDSDKPGLFTKDGELIAPMEEILSLSELKPPELEEENFTMDQKNKRRIYHG